MRLPVAVLDSCVHYSAPLLDLFMWLGLAELYVPKWTASIHEERMRNVLKNRPHLSPEKLRRTRDLMDSHAIGSLVEDYELLIPSLQLPDENDRHVLAAAIVFEATHIVNTVYELKNPPRTMAFHLDVLRIQRLSQTAEKHASLMLEIKR